MADNVQPEAGEQRGESSSGLFISTDPLQDEVGYKLAADDGDADASDSGDDGDDEDYDTDNGDSDGGDDSDDNGPLVVEIGPGARATDGKDSDGTDENDPDYSDN